jgi:hypothetical protein
LALKEPDSLKYNPEEDGPIKDTQMTQLDPNDPLTYQSYVQFPPPLPLDKLIVLNEIQTKIGMGLESKEGALRHLGEEFPEEKLAEIRSELRDDAISDGALQLIKVQIQKEIQDMTGMMPGPDGNSAIPLQPTQLADGDIMGDKVEGAPTPENLQDPAVQEAAMIEAETESALREKLVTEAYGTKIPQRRAVDRDT